MKCLCCQENFEEVDAPKRNYFEVHGVESAYYFFRKLFTKDRVFIPRTCFRCEHFCASERDKKIYNSLVHYQQGGALPAEDKPLTFTSFDKYLQRYSKSFDEYSNFYDFYNPPEIIEEFFFLLPVLFKCTFITVNQQPPPAAGFAEVTDTRVWTTSVYEGIYFNDFIKMNMRGDIKKRIIYNGMTGSSWRFKRFERLCISVNTDDSLEIRR